MTRYSEAFKTAIIAKILSPEKPSIRSVANESSIPIGTVLSWLKQKNINIAMSHELEESQKSVDENSLSEQFNIILKTASMSEEELSAYCRQKGIYPTDIEIWKQELLDNLDARNKKTLASENNKLKVQVRELKSELKLKEKALAESAALLLLKKKAKIIWGDHEDDD